MGCASQFAIGVASLQPQKLTRGKCIRRRKLFNIPPLSPSKPALVTMLRALRL